MIRLFAALPIPPEISAPLAELQKGVTGASWRPIENFHITLRYFGDVSVDLAHDLDDELGKIKAPQLDLSLRNTGWFGRREPYSLHAHVLETEALTGLSNSCERAARRIGLPPEKRPFRPHVTLAYLHGTLVEDVTPYVSQHMGFSSGPFTADRFYLYESRYGKGPSRYIPVAEYPLG